MGENIAYVRVSTADQNPERQKEALKVYGIDRWYEEKISGKDTERPELKAMMDYVREGDTVYVSDFSRLSRNAKDLLQITEQLEKKGVHFISNKENVDTGTPNGRLILTIIGAIAEMERTRIVERVREGVAVAKKQGKFKGKPAKKHENFEKILEKWKNKEITATQAAKELGVCRQTFYNMIKRIVE